MPGAAPDQPNRRDPDLFDRAEAALTSRTGQALWLLAFALATRISVFGDTNFFSDELLYLQIGQRMHDGLLPYVDLWDRKGPGLFLLYYLIAALSGSVLAYQIAAWLFVAATAAVIMMIAERMTGRLAAVLAGTLYIAMLPLFAGGGGQAAVFYNLFVALAGLGVLRALPELDQGGLPPVLILAMASAGFAATFKQTALAEGVFLGLYALWRMRGAGPAKLLGAAAVMALAGAAPTLVFAALYWLAGHFAEFWHAMVTANLTKTYNADSNHWERIQAMLIIGSPVLLPTAAGLLLAPRSGSGLPPGFRWGWGLAALAGLLLLPNFIDHYALPVLVPLCILAAPALDFRRIGAAYAVVAIFFILLVGPALNFEARRASRLEMADLAARITARQPQPRLFVYQGPVYLYRMVGSYPPTPMFFPFHLHAAPEDNTSYFDTADEVRKVLAWQPQVVVVAADLRGNASNRRTIPLVEQYLKQCRLWFRHQAIDYYGPKKFAIYGDCVPAPR